eukprot:8434308-Alexandrium_andersonii.AAC.1
MATHSALLKVGVNVDSAPQGSPEASFAEVAAMARRMQEAGASTAVQQQQGLQPQQGTQQPATAAASHSAAPAQGAPAQQPAQPSTPLAAHSTEGQQPPAPSSLPEAPVLPQTGDGSEAGGGKGAQVGRSGPYSRG